jgi:DNA-binding response OmpR family regulator
MNNSSLQILVIDDDPDIGNILRMTLEYKGFSTSILKSAANCESYIRDNNISLVIMDLLISGSYGVDICRVLKADEALSSIPIIMMSAHPDAERLCVEAGADDFIAKPFDVAVVIDKVKTHLANINPL